MLISLKIMLLVEEWFNCSDGQTKKMIVIEIGENIVENYFIEYLPYYNENIDSIIEKQSKVTRYLCH